MSWQIGGTFISGGITPVTYTGPGDLVGGASAWYGLRAYSRASIGAKAVSLRESGGNTVRDFVTILGGGLDLADISSFKGANSLFVVTLYDQTGNGNHLTQATTANQPEFTLSAIGSLPAMTITAGQSLVCLATSFNGGVAIAQPFTLSAVFKDTATSSYGGVIGDALQSQLYYVNGLGIEIYAGLELVNTDAAVWNSAQGIANGASSAINLNGLSNVTGDAGSRGLGGGSSDIMLGRDGSGFDDFAGLITEAGIWPVAFALDNSIAVSGNQRSYWGI